MKTKLTIKQRILAYIKAHQLSYGYPPTLGKMTQAGMVERQGHSPRAIKVLEG